MSNLSQYNIAFKGLALGKHVFEFVVDDKFFAEFDGSIVDEGLVNVKVTLEKQSSLMTFWFDIKGKVRVQCDRCLEMYDQPIESHERVFVRMGERENVEGDDLIWVSTNDYQLNVAQLIYEFIGLAIPIKRVHPDDENGNSTCDPEMIERLNKYIVREDEQENPVWKDLRKLLDNE
ncbi:MAG: YceD family protein [Candidatus Saccharibacteria bacterium]